MGNGKISCIQLASVIILCRLCDILLYIKDIQSGTDGFNAMVGVALSIIFNFLAVLPIYFLSHKYGGISLNECIAKTTPQFSRVICTVYALVLLLLASLNINHTTLAIDELYIDARYTSLLLILVIIAVFYCAFKGIQALGRTSFTLAVIMLISIITIFCVCIPQFKNAFQEQLFINGNGIVIKSALFNISAYAEVLIYFTLISHIKEKRFKTLILYSAVSLAISLIVIYTVSSVYGSYTAYETFPFFTAIGLSNTGLFRRTDSLFICLWVTLSAVKSSAFVMCAVKFVKTVLPNHSIKKIIGICGVVTAVLCFVIHGRLLRAEYLLNDYVLLIVYITAVIAVPLIYLITKLILENRNEN